MNDFDRDNNCNICKQKGKGFLGWTSTSFFTTIATYVNKKEKDFHE